MRRGPVSGKPSPLVRTNLRGGVVTGPLVSGFAKPGALRHCGSGLPWAALDAGRPSVTMGGKRLWRNRTHLGQAAMTEPQWRARWEATRMFVTADGEAGKPGGNETIRVNEAGRLRIKVPAALVDRYGTHLDIAAPVGFPHRGTEWALRVERGVEPCAQRRG